LLGAGDWERGEGAEICCGGPFAQADFSWVGNFGAVAVEDLLILTRQKRGSQ
jgi:hypothetical protein